MEKSSNFKVFSLMISDSNGDFLGPMRVWIKEGSVPGLAMSRSFGDKIASNIGVIASPGMIILIKKSLNGTLQKRTNSLFWPVMEYGTSLIIKKLI